MMYKITAFALSACVLTLFASNAHAAEEKKDWTLSGSAAFKSDYILRGFSQTDERPAVQGQITASHKSGLAASLWGSNVDFNDGDEASSELDATLSYSILLGTGSLTVGGIYYAYPGANDDLDYDYIEGFATYGLKVMDKADVTASIFYSPNFFAGSGDSIYTNAGISVPLPILDGVSVNGGIGYQWIEDNDAFGAEDYADWTIGTSYTYKNINFGLNYHDTDISENDCNGLCANRIVGSISTSF